MRVLILGGTGRLSSDFTKKVLSQENEVFILNRGKHGGILHENLNQITADLRDESIEELRAKIGTRNYDVVVDFLTFFPEQLEKTLAVISGMFEQYIFISSATAYIKKHEDEIITEENEVGNKTWSYAYNKFLCEKALAVKNVNYTIIRPYVTYGDTRIPFPIIPHNIHKEFTLLARIIEEKPVVLFEDGKAECNLTSTKDFAEVLYRLLLNPKAYKEDFHITSPFVQTWRDVYEELCKILKKEQNSISANIKDIEKYFPDYKELLLGDKGTNMRFDNSKVMKAINNSYEFKIDLAKGLTDSVNYYLTHKEIQNIDCKFDGECDYYIYKKTGKKFSLLKNGVCDNKFYYYLMTTGITHYGVNIIQKLKRKLIATEITRYGVNSMRKLKQKLMGRAPNLKS